MDTFEKIAIALGTAFAVWMAVAAIGMMAQ